MPSRRCAGSPARPRTGPVALGLSTCVISDRLDLVEKRLGIGVEDPLALVAAEIDRLALVHELRLGRVGGDFHHADRIKCHGILLVPLDSATWGKGRARVNSTGNRR